MTLKLYKTDASPPARAVMMVCDILNLSFQTIEVSLPAKEHLKPEFVKKNPVHTIPVLEDGDLIIHDSHAIIIYLVDKYGNDDSLYPKDLSKRALVNQILFFDTGVLFARLKSIVVSMFYDGATSPTPRQIQDVYDAYGFLESFLNRTKYLAGDNITIADISAVAYVTSIIHALPLDARFPKTAAWIKEMEQRPYCQKYNAAGSALIGERLKQAIQ